MHTRVGVVQRVVRKPCALGLCARVVRACARSAGWLCAGVVRKVVRTLCADWMQSLVRIERHKG